MKPLTGDERIEAKQRDEEARVWISGIEAVKAKIGVKATRANPAVMCWPSSVMERLTIPAIPPEIGTGSANISWKPSVGASIASGLPTGLCTRVKRLSAPSEHSARRLSGRTE